MLIKLIAVYKSYPTLSNATLVVKYNTKYPLCVAALIPKEYDLLLAAIAQVESATN